MVEIQEGDMPTQEEWNKITRQAVDEANLQLGFGPRNDYNMDAYKAKYGIPDQSQGQHLPDTFKNPNHMTFSNESIYSNSATPGGQWTETGVPQPPRQNWAFSPSDYNLLQHPASDMANYFMEREPNSQLNLPRLSYGSPMERGVLGLPEGYSDGGQVRQEDSLVGAIRRFVDPIGTAKESLRSVIHRDPQEEQIPTQQTEEYKSMTPAQQWMTHPVTKFKEKMGWDEGGLIPGEVDPNTGDDTQIPAKVGEYVIPVEVVGVIGKDALDEMVYNIKKSLGMNEPPKGMMPEEEGYADGGEVQRYHYRTTQEPIYMNAQERIDSGENPAKAIVGGFAGSIGNVVRGVAGSIGNAVLGHDGVITELTPEARARKFAEDTSRRIGSQLGAQQTPPSRPARGASGSWDAPAPAPASAPTAATAPSAPSSRTAPQRAAGGRNRRSDKKVSADPTTNGGLENLYPGPMAALKAGMDAAVPEEASNEVGIPAPAYDGTPNTISSASDGQLRQIAEQGYPQMRSTSSSFLRKGKESALYGMINQMPGIGVRGNAFASSPEAFTSGRDLYNAATQEQGNRSLTNLSQEIEGLGRARGEKNKERYTEVTGDPTQDAYISAAIAPLLAAEEKGAMVTQEQYGQAILAGVGMAKAAADAAQARSQGDYYAGKNATDLAVSKEQAAATRDSARIGASSRESIAALTAGSKTDKKADPEVVLKHMQDANARVAAINAKTILAKDKLPLPYSEEQIQEITNIVGKRYGLSPRQAPAPDPKKRKTGLPPISSFDRR